MRNIFTLTLILSYCFTLKAQWTVLSTNTSNDINSVDYHSDGTVWMGTFNGILYSPNYANTLVFRPGLDTVLGAGIVGTFDDIFGFSSTTSVATGVYNIGNTEIIYKTSSSGYGWAMRSTNSSVPIPRYLADIDFESGTTGMAVGNSGRILKTTNAGTNWSVLSSGTTAALNAVCAVAPSIYVVAGTNTIRRTTNGGTTWTGQTFSGDFIGVDFSGSTGYSISDNGVFMKSTDQGATWTTIPTFFTNATAMYVIDPLTVFVATNGDLYITRDGGSYWEQYNLSGYSLINKISFYDSQNGIAVGDNGYAIKTTNGGAQSYPVSRFSYTQTAFCTGNSITFTNLTNPAYTFQWLDNGTPVSNAYSPAITITTAGTHTISLVAYNGTGYDTTSTTVTMYDPPVVAPFTITAASDSICRNTSATISVPASVAGVTYKLYNGAAQVGASQNGNGSTLSFATGALTTTTLFTVYGIRANPCGIDTFAVQMAITINYPQPILTYYLEEDTICINQSTNLIVVNSETGWTYTWSASPFLSGTHPPIGGTGDTIIVPLPSVSSTFTISLVATHYSSCVATLTPGRVLRTHNPSANFTASPNPVLTGSPVTITNSSNMTTYSWTFGPNSSPSSYSGTTPPPVSWSVAGIDTITMTAVYHNNVCTREVKKAEYIFDPMPAGTIGECSRTSNNGNITINDLALDRFNNTYMTGFIQISSNNFLTVIKTDSLGNEIWRYVQPYTSPGGNSAGVAVAADDAGNTYVAGSYTGTTFTILGKTFYDKYFILKFDLSGNLVWIVSSATANWRDLIYTSTNELYAVGYGVWNGTSIIFTSGEVFSITASTSSTQPGNGFVLGLDEAGNMISFCRFGKGYPVSNPGSIYSVGFFSNMKVEESANGNLLLSGIMPAARSTAVYEFYNVTMTNNASLDSAINVNQLFLAQYSPLNNNFVYACSVVGGKPEAFTGFTQDPSGNLVYIGTAKQHLLTNSSTSNLEYPSSPQPSFNFLIKSDSAGTMQWITYTKFGNFHDVAAAPDNTLYLLSSFQNFAAFYNASLTGYGMVPNGVSDIAVVQYSPSGQILRAEKKGNSQADVAYQMESDECGNLRAVELWDSPIYNFPNPQYCNCPQTGNLKYVTYTHQSCTGNCCAAYNTASLDISIESVFLSNSATSGSGNRDILLRVRGQGMMTITSARFHFRIDDNPDVVYNWSGNIPYAALEDSLNIGTFNFGANNYYRITAWVELVNNITDNDQRNDTARNTQILCDAPIQGIYTVSNVNGDFVSFTATIETMNACGISGTTIFDVAPGTYNEQLYLTSIAGVSPNDTIVWRSQTGDSTSVVINFKPAWTGRYSTIDMWTDARRMTFQEMTIRNLTNTTNNYVIFMGDSCEYDNFYNNRIEGIPNSSQKLLFQGNITRNNSDHYIGNVFYRGGEGISQSGYFSGPNYDPGLLIKDNIFDNQRDIAISLTFVESPVIIGNTFLSHDSLSTLASWRAINLNSCRGSFRILQNDIHNYHQVLNNYGLINIVSQASVVGNPSLIANNFINNYYPDTVWTGWAIATSNVSQLNILHNTMGSGVSLGTGTNINVKSNLFYTLGNYFAAIPSSYAGITFNDNVYYTDTSIYLQRFLIGGFYRSYSYWLANTGFDANSQWVQPNFVSSTDLHLAPTNTFFTASTSFVPDDIDGETRNTMTPMGADEINPVACAVAGAPVISSAFPTICFGSTQNLTITSGNLNSSTSWQWYSGGCGGISIGSGTSVVVSPTVTTTYFVRGEGGCTSTGPCSSVTVIVDSIPNVTASPSNVVVCSGSSTTLSGGGAIYYSWSGPQTISDSTPFIATTSGTYTVTGIDLNGCSNSAIASVTVNLLPNVIATPPSVNVCVGDSITLAGGGALSYSWSGPELITDNQPFIPTVSGTYSVIGTDGNLCSDTATAVLTVNALPNVTVAQDTTVACSGSSVTLSGVGAVSYTWYGPESITDNTPFAATLSGTYTVTGTDVNSCTDTATATVIINQLPVVTYSESQTLVCINWNAITLTPGSPSGGSYSGPGVTGYTFDPAQAGSGPQSVIYSFSDSNGCVNSASSTITVDFCTVINQVDSTAKPSLFPNPTTGYFVAELGTQNGETTIIKLANTLGEILRVEITTKSTYSSEISEFANGIYFMIIESGSKTTVLRIVLNK